MKLQIPRRQKSSLSFDDDAALAALCHQLQVVDAVPVPPLRFIPPATPLQGLPTPPWFVPSRRGFAYIALTVALSVAAGLGLTAGPTGSGSSSVSAASILERAGQVAAERSNLTGTASFHKVTRAETDHGGRGASVREWRQWGDGPDRWRVEVYASTGTGGLALESVRTSDGSTMYTYDADSGELAMGPYDAPTWRVYGSDGGLGSVSATASLEAVVAAKSDCYTPSLVGKEAVAGRDAYVIDLGRNRCVAAGADVGGGPGGAPVYLMAPVRLWVDAETFSVVRQSNVGGPGGLFRSTTTLVSYERNVPIDDAMFMVDPRKPSR